MQCAVDPATGWFEIAEITDKTSARISQIFNNIWLSRYPRPRKVIFDNGMDPWSELLGSVAWAIRSTHHTTLQATPGQLVLGRDMLLTLKFVTDWEAIKLRKQRDVDKKNSRENSLRIHHDYQVDAANKINPYYLIGLFFLLY